MGTTPHDSPELQELKRIRLLLESLLDLKEEQAQREWRADARGSPAEAGSTTQTCCGEGHPWREPPKADTAERAKASEAVEPSSDAPNRIWCDRCNTWLYGRAHIHTPKPEAK